MQQKYYFIHEMQLLKSSTNLCYARVNQLFPVNATLICFIVVKQSCMINPVVRKISISHFKDSASHRKFAQRVRKVKATVQRVFKQRKVSGKLMASHSSRGSTLRDKNRFTTTISHSGKRTLKWVQGNNSSQKYINVLQKKLLPLTDEAFLHDGYTFMQDNGQAHKSTFTKSCQDTMDIYTTI